MFYSAKTNGFYDEKIGSVPDEAVEISDARYQELMQGQTEGKMIVASDRGEPTLVDFPAPTAEQAQAIRNKKAKSYLNETDWYVVRKMETGVEIPQQVLDARAEARLSIVE